MVRSREKKIHQSENNNPPENVIYMKKQTKFLFKFFRSKKFWNNFLKEKFKMII